MKEEKLPRFLIHHMIISKKELPKVREMVFSEFLFRFITEYSFLSCPDWT